MQVVNTDGLWNPIERNSNFVVNWLKDTNEV